MSSRINKLIDTFNQVYENSPEYIVKAPGRVDLMGNHTDYNEGHVLPVALDVDIIAAGCRRQDRIIHIASMDVPMRAEFSLDDISYDNNAKWTNYIRGVAKYILESGYHISGADILVSSTVPIGSGLSSSAALEMSTGMLFQTMFNQNIPPVELALIGQKAENKFVGVNTGIMDQFISRLGKKNHALYIDCRSFEYKHVPLDSSSVSIVICDTKKRRGLVGSEYDLRRSQCNEAVKNLADHIPDILALRDVSLEQLYKYRNRLSDVVAKRAEHVITENQRVISGCDYLSSGDYVKFGNIMDQSHDSARYLYEVSCEELDIMVEACRSVEGVLGSRLAGAGFGGCTVSLVLPEAVPDVLRVVPEYYRNETRIDPAIYVCSAADGAGILDGWSVK